MTSLRARSSTVKIFQLSGLTDVVRKDLAKKISLLGGKYIDSQAFTGSCTHVICGQLSYSEKFLGALATGKYILHPDYLTASCHAGTFLDEESFEWCDEHIVKKYKVDKLLHLAIATRRCRFLLGNESGAFEGWKVAVIAGAKKSKVIKRLLISGGAEVFNMRIPVKNPAKVADTIGYVFVSENNMKSVVQLIDYGVLCIKPEFIGDFLVKDPQPDPMDYIVQLNDMNDFSTLEEVDPSSQNSFLMESQRSVYLSPHKLTFSQQSDVTSLTSSPASSDRPSSRLTHDSTDRNIKTEQPGPSHVVDAELEWIKKEKADGTSVYDVIDLTDVTEENDFRSDSKIKINKFESDKNTALGKAVVEKETGSFVDMEVNSEPEENTVDNVRQSKRLLGRNSVTESLVPDRNAAVTVQDIKEEEIQVVSAHTKNEDNSRTSPGRQGSSVKRNLMESLNERTKPTIQVTSTPLKTLVKKKHLLQAGLNMSPITKFFKRIEPSAESRTDRQNKSDIAYRATSISPVQDHQLNRSDPVNIPTDSGISNDENMNCPSRLNIVTDQTDENNQTVKDQSKNIIENVGNIVNDEPMYKQNDSVLVKQSGKKQSLDEKQDGKRKSTDKADALSPEPSNCKRVTRSTPTKKSEICFVRTPGKNPDIDSFTTIYISPSRKKPLTVKPMEVEEESPVKTSEDLQKISSSQVCDRNSLQGRTDLDIGKKRKADQDQQLQHVIQDIKRRKINSGEWCTSVLSADLRETEDLPESVCMASTTTEIFLATLEDGFTFEALQYLSSQITFKYYPQSRVISELLRNVLLSANEEIIANMSYNILSRILLLHPPITAALQDVYLRALAGCKEGEEWQVGAEWNFIDQCISNILTSDDSRFRRNNLLVFRLILQMIQQNLKHLSVFKTECDTRHLLLRIIWSPSYHVVFNKRCRTLVEDVSDVVQIYQAKTCVSEKSMLLEVLDGVLWMVAMVTECCRTLECGNVDQIVALQAASTSAFVHEISRKLIDLDVKDPVLLENIFRGLQLSWLKVGVCQQMLNKLDDYLLAEDSIHDTKSLNFLIIVARYIYLLPVFDVKPRSQGLHSPARTKTKQTTKISDKKCLTENTDMNKENVGKMTLKANKRNPKGETPLHVACIRNDVVAVKRLLKVPGIDVNATDNVGWTPLHEACNHGNVECVMELLKFVPSKTMDVFFSKDSTCCRKVDLLASNGEGITPLHDAVLNNQVDVCQVLLQHGGPKLLQAQTILGYTPLDLAETDDMVALLTSYSNVRRKHDDSLNLIGSQDSTCSTDETAPRDSQYEQVLYVDRERVYVNIKSAIHYVHLVTLLVKHYIAFRNLHIICDTIKDAVCQPSVEFSDQGKCCREDTMQNSSGNGVCQCRNKSWQDSQSCYSQNEHTSDCGRHSSRIKQTSLKYEKTVQDVDQDEFLNIKKDLKILKNMSHYIELFKAHLLKICRPEDSNVIEKELQELIFVTEIS